MGRLKSGWLITHDDYIDRRIFFFSDVLIELGYEIKLFSFYPSKEIGGVDPSFVCRPEKIQQLQEYSKNIYFSVNDIEDSLISKSINNFIQFQSQYFLANHTYAKNLEELQVKGFQVIDNIDITVIAADTVWYSSAFRYKNTDKWYIYNTLIGKVRVFVTNENDPILNQLEKLIYFLKKRRATQLKAQYTLEEIYHDGWNPPPDIEVNLENKGDYQVLTLRRIGDPEIYEYLGEEDIIRKKEYYSNLPLGSDTLLGKSFNYQEFREVIFEYSPILQRINFELKLKNPPELVYVADLPTLPIGVMLKEQLNCKLVVDCHEWWKEQSLLWEPDNHRRVNMMDKYEQYLYPLCDIRITVGTVLAERMRDYFKCNFDVIYSCLNKVDLNLQDLLNSKEEFWSHNLGIPNDSKVAIFQGSLTTLRNLDNLAKATKYLSENQFLVVVGGGDYKLEFEKILIKEGNPERVKMVGWVNQDQLLEYTVRADVGVLPYKSISDYYSMSMPNKFLEYYSSQIPIICDSSMVELSSIVNNDQIGVSIDCSNPEVLGRKINFLLENESERKMLKDNYSKIRKRFDFSSQRKKFIEILTKHGVLE